MKRRVSLALLAAATAALAVVAMPAHASTPGCTDLGQSCGDNTNQFGNGWDVFQQHPAWNQPLVSWPNTATDPATDFARQTIAFHTYRYQYAPNGHNTDLCAAEVAATPFDKILLRTCNTGPWDEFRVGTAGPGGNQLLNLATGKPVQTNGTGSVLTAGGTYAGGSWFTWEAGGTSPVTASQVTSITNDPDSGNHGTWATDTFSRTVTLYEHGAASPGDCGGFSPCYFYTGTLKDSGTFVAADAALSPNAGAVIDGPVDGSFSGGGSYSFYATDAAPNAGIVPASHDDLGVPPSGDFRTTSWFRLFFSAGTHFGGIGLVGNWGWTYTSTSACVTPVQTWVDAASNSGGSIPSAGDITGDAAC